MNLPNKLTISRFGLTLAFMLVMFSQMRFRGSRLQANGSPEQESEAAFQATYVITLKRLSIAELVSGRAP